MPMKIHYKTATDETGIVIDYYIAPDPEEGRIKWLFYPQLPAGMAVQKGDEMRLGVMHDYDRQAYADFLKKPRHALSAEIYCQVIGVMDRVD